VLRNPHHVDADPDPDPAFYIDAVPDPDTGTLHADPDPIRTLPFNFIWIRILPLTFPKF
jgi:hypothetical protein